MTGVPNPNKSKSNSKYMELMKNNLYSRLCLLTDAILYNTGKFTLLP